MSDAALPDIVFTPLAPVKPLAHHEDAIARGANCLACPLYNCGQGPVLGKIVPGSVMTLIEESPSNSEIETGQLFSDFASDTIFESLAEGGVEREQVSYTSAISCRPPGGHMLEYLATLKAEHKKRCAKAKAAKEELPQLITPQDCCAPRLARDIEEAGSKVLLSLGTEALKATASQLNVPFANAKVPPGTPRIAPLKKQHGSPVVTQSGRVVTSAMHPLYAIFGNSTFLPVIKKDIERAARIAVRGGLIDWREPEFILKPSIDTCVNVMRMLQQAGSMITVDVETDGVDVKTTKLRCVGLGGVVDGREIIIVIPLRHMNGHQWWSPGDLQRLQHVLTELLESNPLSGHNLLFDTAVLLNHGILKNRAKRWFDTMIAHHDTDQSELPHDLGFVAARFFEAMRWKDDADHKNVEGVDDYWLHLYCAKDVLGEMRLIVPLAQQIDKNGTINAFKTDTALAPVARDMGDLGINIDEQRRRKFFDILDRATAQLTIDIQRITGIPDFNPNAFKQVSRFLFVIKGLSPPYATDGREWSELSDEDEEVPLDTDDPEVILAKAATNELSLLRLLELGVDEQTRQFIEAELMYRGLQKCKATYIGLKAEGDGDDRRIIDTHRERGYIHTENHGPGLMNLSILSASWKVHITPTGRWATSPNVQNWPERVVYSVEKYRDALKAGRGTSKKPFDIDGGDGIINTRAMVIAVPGHTLVGADYAAIELRIYAIQAGDALLLDAIRTGKDPHALNYATMMARNPGEVMTWYERVKNSPEQVKKYLRNIAKRFAFLVIYGGQKDQLFKTMSADREPDGTRSFPDLKPGDCAMWFDNFHRAHPETRIWQERVVRAWQTHGFVATILDGRRRFFIGGIDQTAMPNMTIQGSAAAIMNRAMQQIAVECPHRGWSPMSGPILQVHDFAGLQTPEERGVEGMQLLKRVMPYEHNGMRFDVEEKMGKTWNVI